MHHDKVEWKAGFTLEKSPKSSCLKKKIEHMTTLTDTEKSILHNPVSTLAFNLCVNLGRITILLH